MATLITAPEAKTRGRRYVGRYQLAQLLTSFKIADCFTKGLYWP